MAQSEVLIQFCVRQNRLIELLERLHHSIDRYFQQNKKNPSSRMEKIGKQLSHLQERLSKEIDQFTAFLQRSAPDALALRAPMERLMAELRQWKLGGEEGSARLHHLRQKVFHFKAELKNLDLKVTLGHMADAVLIDRFDTLGEVHAIQWPRKFWHVLASLMIVSIYLFLPNSFQSKMVVFGVFTAYALLADTLRLVWPKFNALVVRDLQKFMRKREIAGLNSMTFYALSTFLVCLLFPKGVAILAVLFLGLGDTAASIVGILWGRHKISRRFSWEGSLAFFFTCFFLMFLYPLLVPTFSGNLWLLAFTGGLIGMVSEWCSFRLDDNLVIPLFSAFFLQLATWMFSIG